MYICSLETYGWLQLCSSWHEWHHQWWASIHQRWYVQDHQGNCVIMVNNNVKTSSISTCNLWNLLSGGHIYRVMSRVFQSSFVCCLYSRICPQPPALILLWHIFLSYCPLNLTAQRTDVFLGLRPHFVCKSHPPPSKDLRSWHQRKPSVRWMYPWHRRCFCGQKGPSLPFRHH